MPQGDSFRPLSPNQTEAKPIVQLQHSKLFEVLDAKFKPADSLIDVSPNLAHDNGGGKDLHLVA